MAQVKIYGRSDELPRIRQRLSDLLQACLHEAFGLPLAKRFHRFVPLAPENFVYPDERSAHYTIVEVSLFEGRSAEAKKRFLRLVFERAESELGLDPVDLELTLFETPRANWGIRGKPGDELDLEYRVKV